HLIELTLQIRVELSVVPLSSTPHHIVLAAEPYRSLHALAHLRRAEGDDIRIGMGCRARLIARMGEEVGRAPQRPDTDLGLFALERIDRGSEMFGVLTQGVGRGHDVEVVKGIKRRAEL